MPEAKEKFRKAYNEVFDEKGHIITCGREKCKELISCAKEIRIGNFGDEKTGIMRTEALKLLYRELFPDDEKES